MMSGANIHNAALPGAPALQVSEWLNTPNPVELSAEFGRVVVIEAFQMLCPGCVSHGVPQAKRVREVFHPKDVTVLGLHSVFEHHAAQGSRIALEAFLHEYHVSFPVAIDASTTTGIPATMAAYGFQGTPSLAVIDRKGRLRYRHFGQVSDLLLGAQIMELVAEQYRAGVHGAASGYPRNEDGAACNPDGCTG